MIERKFILENLKEFKVKEYVREQVKKAGVSEVRVQKTPLGEKIVIVTPRPGLIVGRKGQNIRSLTEDLKVKFGMENPKIEIEEVQDVNLDPNVVADKIANSLEKYGLNRFKAIGHKAMDATMRSGARGVEILISGKVPSSRARTWRFYSGYMKKSGEFNKVGVLKAITSAKLKTGIVGIQVRIMPPNAKLPDSLNISENPITVVEEVTENTENKPAKKSTKKPAKKSTKKSQSKKSSKSSSKKTKQETDTNSKDANAEDTNAEDTNSEDKKPAEAEAVEKKESVEKEGVETTAASKSDSAENTEETVSENEAEVQAEK